MRRSGLVRPQAIMVVLVILVLLSRGEVRFIADGQNDDAQGRQLAVATEAPDAPSTSTPTTSPSPPAPSPTPLPSPTPELTPTAVPSPTPSPTPQPTPTPTPVPTERPPAPPSGDDAYAVVVSQPQSGRQEIAITFDAGDGRGRTDQILDILAQHGVVATFGVTGEWVTANPDLLQEMVARGHQVMNHGYSHQSFTGQSSGGAAMTGDQVRAEVLDTEQAIWELSGGYEVGPYFRFPYGDYNAGNLATLKQLGYDYTIWWGCDSRAWMGRTADEIVRECGQELIAPGLIVLLHVDQDADVEALPRLIEIYRTAGYALVTVEQLIQP